MEGKKLISIKVSTILIIALILIGILLFLKHTNSNKAENTISNTSINTTNTENTLNSTSSTNMISNSIDNASIISSRYEEIDNNLNGIDVLFVTDALNNGDDTYTLQGVIYTQYTLSQTELDEIICRRSRVKRIFSICSIDTCITYHILSFI